MSENNDMGACPAGTGLSPTVEPVPVSPPDGASIPSAWLSFNVNDEVRVKLTTVGIERMRRRHDELNKVVGGALGAFRQPKVDDDGWSRFQLWTLISELGGALTMGRPVPFETTMQISAQAIEARRAETGTGSVHESAVGNADAPNSQEGD